MGGIAGQHCGWKVVTLQIEVSAMRILFISSVLLLAGCCTAPAPMSVVQHVDIPRFMGKWYVIANIPTAIEKDAHNAVESYQLNDDGTIDTTFTFNAGSVDGKVKTYHPKGFILDRNSNAIWGMRFVWPIKADYRIAYLAPDYSETIIARQRRDYVWIMARTPHISDDDYYRLVSIAASLGYDRMKIQRVPQR